MQTGFRDFLCIFSSNCSLPGFFLVLSNDTDRSPSLLIAHHPCTSHGPTTLILVLVFVLFLVKPTNDMSSHNQPDSRTSRLNSFFTSVLSGSKQLTTSKQGELFLNSIWFVTLPKLALAADYHSAQVDPPTCIEKLISSPSGLSSVQNSLRLDTSPTFINGPASGLLQYITHSSLKLICGGDFLRQIVLKIAQPPIFWNAFAQCILQGKLETQAQESFGWLLAELLCLDAEKRIPYIAIAQDRAIQKILNESSDFGVRHVGQRVRRILDTLDTVTYSEAQYGAGGRHDNDFADFRQISILPTADELTSEELPFLRPADAIDDVEKACNVPAVHLDNQFRLLRDDMLTEMREELHIMLGKKTGRRRGLVFEGFRLFGIDCGKADRPETWRLQLQFLADLSQLKQVRPKGRKKFFEDNHEVLKHEALVCLLVDGEIIAFPTVHRKSFRTIFNLFRISFVVNSTFATTGRGSRHGQGTTNSNMISLFYDHMLPRSSPTFFDLNVKVLDNAKVGKLLLHVVSSH